MTYFVPAPWEGRGHIFWLLISLGHSLVTGMSQEKAWLHGCMMNGWVGEDGIGAWGEDGPWAREDRPLWLASPKYTHMRIIDSFPKGVCVCQNSLIGVSRVEVIQKVMKAGHLGS